MSAAIETQNLTRRFGSVTALDGVCLSIEKGEFFSLLGPSGCGKTTLLRIIAGLDWPDEGALKLNAADALSLPAHRRPVNTVFQSYALFPHMTVEENVGFGLRMKKAPAAEIPGRVKRVMEMVEIGALAGRKPAQLSGGQRQRVALARAIVNEPEVLLLDEPLGALDLKLRKQLQSELHQLQRRLGITFVYVTHDQEEAMAMSDRIAVMNHGRIEQLGEPAGIYDRPQTRFVAEFLGSCNLVKGSVVSRQCGGVAVKTELGDFVVAEAAPAGDVLLTVRPEKLRLGRERRDGAIPGRITAVVYNGAQTQYEVACASGSLKVFVLNGDEGVRFREGEEVGVSIAPEAWRILET